MGALRDFAADRVEQPSLRLNLFGSLSATTVTGLNALPRTRKAQAILCYLAVAEDDRVPRQRLIDLLWSTRWPDQGRASLRQALIELRACLAPLGDILVIDRRDVRLDRRSVWVDKLSRPSDDRAQRISRASPDPAIFLEPLRGVDPGFDQWVTAAQTELAAAMGTASPDERREAASPLTPAANRRVVISVAPIIQIGTEIDEIVAPSLTLELVSAIARFRWLGVRQSPEAGAADYRVEGYITMSGDGPRLVLRLIDEHEQGTVAWSGQCRLPLPPTEQALAALTEALVAQLDPEIFAIETRKAFEKPVSLNGAYACVLQAMALLYRFEQLTWMEARLQVARAQELDPFCARAFAVSALCHITGIAQGWDEAPATALALADADARRAIGIDPRDSLGLALAGHIRAFVHHDFEAALALFDRALRANSSCGFAWGYSALTHAYLGQPDEARSRLARATSILLHDPYLSFVEGFEAVICYFAGEYDAVIAVERGQLAQRPKFTNSRKNIIAALCHLGRFAEARAEQAILEADEPGFTWDEHLRVYPFGRPIDREALGQVLRAGGLTGGDGPQLVALPLPHAYPHAYPPRGRRRA